MLPRRIETALEMRVVQILPELNEGGVERGTIELNREFAQRGIDSIVISAGGRHAGQIDADGGRHVAFGVASKNPLTAPARVIGLRRLISSLEPDIVHARSRVPAWLTFLANRPLGIPFVTTVHGLNRVNRYSKVMTFGDRVITVSEVIRDYIVDNYGTSPEKIRVIQRGVDTRAFDPASVDRDFIAEFRSRHGLEGKYTVTSVGRLTEIKDFEGFIRAVASLKEEIPDLMGLIVGGAHRTKTRYAESLRDLAKAEGVEDRVVFAGYESQVAEIYALSDLTVNAQIKMGNVARTISESLAMGTPVLATTFKGLGHLITDGRNGFVIRTQDPADLAEKIRLARQLQYGDLRAELNPEFTLETMVARTLAVYEELVGVEGDASSA